MDVLPQRHYRASPEVTGFSFSHVCVLWFCVELPQNTQPEPLAEGQAGTTWGRRLGSSWRGLQGCPGTPAGAVYTYCTEEKGSGRQPFPARHRPRCAPPPPGALFKSRSGFSSSGLSPRVCISNLTNCQVMPMLQGPPLGSQWCKWGCAVTKPCRPQLHVGCARTASDAPHPRIQS